MTRGLITTLDDLSRRTGIPAFAEGQPRRRLLRWTPVVALAMAIPGLGIEFLSTGRQAFYGHALLTYSFVIATFCPIFGPVKPWGTADWIDEWDRDLRRRSFLVAFASMAFTGLVLFCTITAAAAFGNWSASETSFRAMGCTFFLMTLYSAVPTLYASWTIRPLDPDEDEA